MEGEQQHNQLPQPAVEEPERQAGDQAELVPRIYVASLTDYNAGRLHGVWLDAAQEPAELHDAITGMLEASPEPKAEEWAIHDVEGFNGLHLGEWEDLDYVSLIAKGIAEHGRAFAHWATLAATDEDLAKFEEAYLGRWESLTDYAREVLEDLGLQEAVERCVPENLRPYVRLDAEAFGRDLEIGGNITTTDGEGGGVYVFSNRW